MGPKRFRLQRMLGTLHSIIEDMGEFIVFLKSYPPISREPYNRYLFMENCMFGRQAEMEKVINFLLQPEPPGAQGLQVLPIIGPRRVGKSTLVEHVCYDERVRNHFLSIILYSVQGGAIVKKQNHGSHERSLVIMDLADDLVLDERECKKLYSSGSHLPLALLQGEAFGSTNPEEHQELASIAMEIAAELDGSFVGANTIIGYLRANMHNWFWRKMLQLQRNHVERNILLCGEHPHNLLQRNRTVSVRSMSNMWLKVCYREKQYHQNEVPKIMLHEVQNGTANAHGKFDVVVWKSRIPPYHSYVMSCEMEAPQDITTKKKRSHSMM